MAVSTTQPWFRSFALCTLASLALPGVAAAQGVAPEDATAEQRDQASEAFREGRTAFDERRFSDAITGFRASYDIVASPNAHLMIGHSQRELGRDAEAYETFGRVALEAEAAADQDEKYLETATLAREEQARLRPTIALLSITVPPSSAGATLTVGGRTIPSDRWNEPIAVEPGKVVVVLTGGDEPLVQSVEATAGGSASLDLTASVPEVVKAPEAPKAPPPPQPPADDWRWDGTQRYAAYAVTGLGVVSLIAAAGTGGAALSKHGELEDACGAPCPDRQDDIDAGKRLMHATNALVAIGVVAVGAGVTLFFTAPDDTEEVATHVVVGPGSLAFEGRF